MLVIITTFRFEISNNIFAIFDVIDMHGEIIRFIEVRSCREDRFSFYFTLEIPFKCFAQCLFCDKHSMNEFDSMKYFRQCL